MRPKGDRAQAERVNTLLAQIKSRVEELFFDALITQKTLTAERFEQMFDKGAPAGDFLAFMMAEIDEVKGTQATGTVKAWMSTYNHLKRYQPKIGFGDITLEFVKGFDAYLQRQKFDQNYIVKHHRFIRKFVLLANKRGKRIPNPYNEFKIREVQKERDYLTGQEVKILRELYESRQLKPHLQVTLRHFLFQIGTSLRYSDLAVMTKENVVNGLLVFCPVKTARVGRLVKCPLSEMALQMLQDSESTGQKLFMVPAEQTMNRWLKEIAEFAGISKRLTTHMGRHTYGFLFIASGGQVEVLQKIMGHADLKTTQIYTHIDNSQIVDGVEQINRFLNTVMVE
jgi:site-specific recombinase XerD